MERIVHRRTLLASKVQQQMRRIINTGQMSHAIPVGDTDSKQAAGNPNNRTTPK
jgi:hypothetical protein